VGCMRLSATEMKRGGGKTCNGDGDLQGETQKESKIEVDHQLSLERNQSQWLEVDHCWEPGLVMEKSMFVSLTFVGLETQQQRQQQQQQQQHQRHSALRHFPVATASGIMPIINRRL
jgi:hypothetical protein